MKAPSLPTLIAGLALLVSLPLAASATDSAENRAEKPSCIGEAVDLTPEASQEFRERFDDAVMIAVTEDRVESSEDGKVTKTKSWWMQDGDGVETRGSVTCTLVCSGPSCSPQGCDANHFGCSNYSCFGTSCTGSCTKVTSNKR